MQVEHEFVVAGAVGDRQANRALYVIALNRMRIDPVTRAYAERRRAQGLSNRDIIRCLKRYLARRLYTINLNRLRIRPAPSPALAGVQPPNCPGIVLTRVESDASERAAVRGSVRRRVPG